MLRRTKFPIFHEFCGKERSFLNDLVLQIDETIPLLLQNVTAGQLSLYPKTGAIEDRE